MITEDEKLLTREEAAALRSETIDRAASVFGEALAECRNAGFDPGARADAAGLLGVAIRKLAAIRKGLER